MSYPITKTGFEKLEAEHKRLKTHDRPAVSEEIATARDHGDLKENAEYHAARDKQSFIEGRIGELEDMIAKAQVVDVAELKGSRVVFGATVELVDCESDKEVTYQIVGEYEADLENGKISYISPIAKGLIGKEEGDEVTIKTPGGTREYEILNVSFA